MRVSHSMCSSAPQLLPESDANSRNRCKYFYVTFWAWAENVSFESIVTPRNLPWRVASTSEPHMLMARSSSFQRLLPKGRTTVLDGLILIQRALQYCSIFWAISCITGRHSLKVFLTTHADVSLANKEIFPVVNSFGRSKMYPTVGRIGSFHEGAR